MGRVQQVITNFVTNAVKYTHKGHIRVGWKISSAPSGGEENCPPSTGTSSQEGLLIFCEDTGAGIPKEKQERVFERFYKLNDYVQGTGLGLAICKSIAQGCGGQIGLESEGDGKGSTFWIWIPCKRID
jgi:signal transduction histidine kinase